MPGGNGKNTTGDGEEIIIAIIIGFLAVFALLPRTFWDSFTSLLFDDLTPIVIAIVIVAAGVWLALKC